jgi:hypothetical protein
LQWLTPPVDAVTVTESESCRQPSPGQNARHRMEREADKWFYDLGQLAKVVENNDHRSRLAMRRVRVIAAFAVFVAVALAIVIELQQNKIVRDARVSCMSNQLLTVRLNALVETDKLPVPRC